MYPERGGGGVYYSSFLLFIQLYSVPSSCILFSNQGSGRSLEYGRLLELIRYKDRQVI